MKIRVVDLETTGKSEDRLAGKPIGIVEIGWTDIDDTYQVSKPESRLVNPCMPIPPEARAVHHISEAMVSDGMYPGEAAEVLMAGMEPGDLFAAHNYEFERAFFPGGAFGWICTMRCARHLWEDAPGYSNQALRYWLNLEDEFEWPELTMPPHRAGPDSYVTAHILGRLLMMKHPAGLVELTNKIPLMKTVPFGKYEGKLWSEMDEGYLNWVLDPARNFSTEVVATARHYLQRLRRSSSAF